MTHHPAMIALYISKLEAMGHTVGPRSGMLTAVNGIWRTDTWLALHTIAKPPRTVPAS